MLLEIKGLTKCFGGLTAVDHIDFQLTPQQIVAVIGPNGSGKTTFFNLISGVIPITSGSIILNGHDVSHNKAYQTTALGLARTFQNIRLFGSMSVEENIIIARHCRTKSGLIDALFTSGRLREERKRTQEKARECLDFVGLYEKRAMEARNLPYGAQRRLEIARALATDPSIILLDEPAAGMNPAEIDDLLDVIRRLQKRKLTVILIEHQMRLVMSIAQRVLVFDHGAKIAEGLPLEVQNNPKVIEAYLGSELRNDEDTGS